VRQRAEGLLDEAELSDALEEVWALVRRLNRYVEQSRPFDLAKDASEAGRLDQVLYSLAEGLRVALLLLHAYMPTATATALDALAEPERTLSEVGERGGGQLIRRIPSLFPVEGRGS
jgi:methionyl-tRNA synthetase